MKIQHLDELIDSGDLLTYVFETMEEEPGSGSREHDRLILVLPSGKSIAIDTVCSGSMENTGIIVWWLAEDMVEALIELENEVEAK